MDILKQIAASQFAQVWANAHSQLKKTVAQQDFEKQSQDVQLRLRSLEQAQLVDARLIEFSSVGGQSAQVACGSVDPKAPNYLQVQVVPGSLRQAVALVELPHEPMRYVASLQLAEEAGVFKLAGLTMNPSSYKGKAAKDYAQSAEDMLGQHKLLSAYVDSATAALLARLGPTLHSSQEIQLNARYAEIEKNQELKPELTSWQVKGTDYQIVRIGLTSTLDDLVPTVLYLSHQKLSENPITVEATSMMEYVRGKYPELGLQFVAVLFQAYNEIPSDPNHTYAYYRVPIFFQPQ
ncbi:MAG: hypothetical protein WCF84_05105 [Anaerolineae bacterium]